MPETQESKDRAEIAQSVWNTEDSAEQSPEVKTKTDEVPAEEPVDPWAGIPAALRDEVMGLRSKVGEYDALSFRLKQTEARLGGITNELHAAKEAAKIVENAPTKEQIEQAATSQAAWDSLKEDFSEWTIAIEGKLTTERAEILKQVPNVEDLKQEMQTANGAELEKLKIEFGTTVVALKHPDFKTIAEDRQKRLELSQTTPGHKLPPIKSEGDMSESEIRAQEAKRIWG